MKTFPNLPPKSRRTFVLAGVFFVAFSLVSVAGKISFRLSDEKVPEHRTVAVIFEAENETEDYRIEYPSIEGLRFQTTGKQNVFNSTTTINGRTTRISRYELRLLIDTDGPGVFTVEGLRLVSASGNSLSVPAFTVAFEAVPANPDLRVELKPLRPVFYPNEKIQFKLALKHDGVLEEARFNFRLFERIKELDLGYVDRKHAIGTPGPKITVGRYQIEFLIGYDPDFENTYEAFFEFVPENGQRSFSPAYFEAVQRLPSEFGVKRRRTVAKSSPLSVEIKPFPAEDRPPYFAGAVGRDVEIEAFVDGRSFQVGDPLPLRIAIAGNGEILGEVRGNLIETPGEADFERGGVQNLVEEKNGVAYSEILYPKRNGDLEIPPVVFSYFDPLLEKYRTVFTEALSVAIAEREWLDEGDIFVPDRLDGRSAFELKSLPLPGDEGETLPVFLLGSALAFPPVAFSALFFLLGWKNRRRASLNARRIERNVRRLLRSLETSLDSPGFMERARSAFHEILREKYGLKKGYVASPAESKRFLGKELGETVVALQTEIDKSAYSHAGEACDEKAVLEKLKRLVG